MKMSLCQRLRASETALNFEAEEVIRKLRGYLQEQLTFHETEARKADNQFDIGAASRLNHHRVKSHAIKTLLEETAHEV